MSLNDSYEDGTLSLSKKRCKESHRPRSAPLATRLSAHKHMNSPESTALDEDNPTTDTFTAIPTPSTSTLEGVPNVDKQLPDLVQGFIRPVACIGSGDPVRVLHLYTTITLDEVCSIYC